MKTLFLINCHLDKHFKKVKRVLKTPVSIFIFFLFFSCNENKQEAASEASPAYWEDIRNFKNADSLSFPPANAILFIGSSSFTLWKDVQEYFPGYTIINRGFGGSTLVDQIRYAGEIIFPYKPKQIIIYCGENDLAFDGVSASVVFERFKKLFQIIREKFSEIPVAFISMKPSPSRRSLIPAMREGNRLIKEFLSGQKNTDFIEVHNPMLDESGEPISEIFLSDSLHMNAKGYAIWQKAIQPFLLKN
jgi:lysophospholipase L1-like esterase